MPHRTTELLVTAAAALVAGRLFWFGLARKFPALFSWSAWKIFSTAMLAVLSPKSLLYFWSYVAMLPLECLFGIVAVRELFALVFAAYPGIRTIGRWATYGAVALSLAATLSATQIFWSQSASGRAHSNIYYVQLGHRAVIFSLAIVIISLLYSISRYPLHLGRNAYLSCACFGTMFLGETAQSLLDSLAPKLFNHSIDWATNLFMAFCLLAWAAMLRPAEEAVATRVTFSSPAEDDLLRELASLNQLLSRATRQ